jgi:type I restriction enzyme, S subunit
MDVSWKPFTSLLAKIIDNRGKTAPTEQEGIPLIATNCIVPENLYPTSEKIRFVSLETYQTWFRGHPSPGDILFVTKGSPGRTALVPNPVDFCIAQDMVALRPDPSKVYPPYLFAVLRSRETLAAIENLHVGTLIPHFKKGDFNKLQLPVPDKKSQEYIGDLYLELSKKIELNRKMNATLDELARTIFRSWFVDFDPVRTKEEGRQPFGMDAETAALFPDRFVESELGPIPEGWRASTVGAEFNVTMGQSPPGSTYNEEGNGLPFYQGRTDFGFRFPSERVYCTAPTRLASKGDSMISVRAPVGDANIAIADCAIGRGVAAVRHESGSISFTYHTVRALGDRLARFNDEGTVFGAINQSDLKGLPVIASTADLVDAFHEIVSPFDQLVEANELESRTLAELRDTLLPELISGRIRVPVAEKAVAAVG